MYILHNKIGNVVKKVETSKERDFYLKLGYIVKPTEKLPKKEGEQSDVKQRKVRTKKDI